MLRDLERGRRGPFLGRFPDFFHCACGDIFRSLDTRTDVGQRFVSYSSKGDLVPDELTVELWEAQIDNWTDSHIYKPDIDLLVLDGIPRNVRQAEILEDYLKVHQVFHLSCPDRDELARRMRKRALKDNRIDDASDVVIEQRIKTYEEETKPIIEYYADNLVTEIDASRPPVEVLNSILSRVTELEFYHEFSDVTV